MNGNGKGAQDYLTYGAIGLRMPHMDVAYEGIVTAVSLVPCQLDKPTEITVTMLATRITSMERKGPSEPKPAEVMQPQQLPTPAITEFRGPTRWLSNFWPCFVELDGVMYPSTENAYQAAKAPAHLRSEYTGCTAKEAKAYGYKVPLPADWDTRRVEVMYGLLKQKFAPGTELADRLVKTWPAELIEGNTWGDTFWGVCNGEGHNTLGRMLGQIRAELMREGQK